MRARLLAMSLLMMAATSPAAADTLQEVATHGIVILLGGRQIDVDYTPDGKFTVNSGQATGTWRIDGDRLCAIANGNPEACVPYPKGKTSGDSFDVTGPEGPATVRIK
jgi:hypothetical protein